MKIKRQRGMLIIPIDMKTFIEQQNLFFSMFAKINLFAEDAIKIKSDCY